MTWVALLSTLLAIVRSLASWMESKQILEAGAAQAVIKGVREADEAIAKAQKTRSDVRLDAERNPGNVLNDDGFKRPD